MIEFTVFSKPLVVSIHLREEEAEAQNAHRVAARLVWAPPHRAAGGHREGCPRAWRAPKLHQGLGWGWYRMAAPTQCLQNPVREKALCTIGSAATKTLANPQGAPLADWGTQPTRGLLDTCRCGQI